MEAMIFLSLETMTQLLHYILLGPSLDLENYMYKQ